MNFSESNSNIRHHTSYTSQTNGLSTTTSSTNTTSSNESLPDTEPLFMNEKSSTFLGNKQKGVSILDNKIMFFGDMNYRLEFDAFEEVKND